MFTYYVLDESDFSLEIPGWMVDKANALGLSTENFNKFIVIHAIQVKEGFRPCYKSAGQDIYCPNINCCWHSDCKGA